MLKIKTISSLEKVFPDDGVGGGLPEYAGCSALRGERLSFQLAMYSDRQREMEVSFQSELDNVEVRSVENAPCGLAGIDFDDNFLRKAPGLFPDILMPLPENVFILRHGQWKALWITASIPERCPPGRYAIRINLKRTEFSGKVLVESEEYTVSFIVEVLGATLPAQRLMRSEWFHADCIYQYYRVPCWSEAHWTLLESYFKNATEHGINMLLTPLWTPPLDTAQGGERPTVQLLDIERSRQQYRFDFSRLERWLDLGIRCGFTYFDFAHAFTQWGAGYTPKIMVRENGAVQKRFGWHVPADSPDYADFLKALFPLLIEVVKRKGLDRRVFFHVSDEPRIEHMAAYQYSAGLMHSLIGDIPTIDALSRREFLDQGLVGIPAVANDKIDAFDESRQSSLFTYYCVAHWNKVPNRFFAMPSARNRIMGVLLYIYDLTGFLHWGYNFWYTQYSRDQNIDPFYVTDAGGAFPGGDAFAVYPGKEGPVDSIRHEVFAEGLQDLRALRLLEEKIGRSAVLEIVHSGLYYKITMKRYPQDAAWLLDLRRRVNSTLEAVL